MRSSFLYVLCSLALTGCATTFRGLPSDWSNDKGWQPVKLKYEKTEMLFVKSQHDDVKIERVFVNPRDPQNMVVTITFPIVGVMATSDGGKTWSINEVKRVETEYGSQKVTVRGAEYNVGVRTTTTRWYVFTDLLFASQKPGTIYASEAGRFWRSDDAGQTWHSYSFVKGNALNSKQTSIDLLQEGADGTVFAMSGEDIYLSHDGGQSWATTSIDAYDSSGSQKAMSVLTLGSSSNYQVLGVVADPQAPNVLYASVSSHDLGEDLAGVGKAMAAVASGTPSATVQAALDLYQSNDTAPRTVTLGNGRDGVYVSRDSGNHWEKSGLLSRTYLMTVPGAPEIYAVLCDTALSAVAQQGTGGTMGHLISQASHGETIDWAQYQSTLTYPADTSQLLFADLAHTVIMRSADQGRTWSRVLNPPGDLQTRLLTQLEKQIAESHQAVGAGTGDAAKVGGFGPLEQLMATLTAEPSQALVLANYGMPLHDVTPSPSAQVYYAYVPTSDYWDGLAKTRVYAMQKAADKMAEHALPKSEHKGFQIHFGAPKKAGDGIPNSTEDHGQGAWNHPNLDFVSSNGTFQLMRSQDGGAHWEVVADKTSVQQTFDPDGSLLKDQKIVLFPRVIGAGGDRVFVLLTATTPDNHVVAVPYQFIP